MLSTQILLLLSLVGLGLSDPSKAPWLTALFALLTAFFSASQDIVIDAFRVEILDEKSYGKELLPLYLAIAWACWWLELVRFIWPLSFLGLGSILLWLRSFW